METLKVLQLEYDGNCSYAYIKALYTDIDTLISNVEKSSAIRTLLISDIQSTIGYGQFPLKHKFKLQDTILKATYQKIGEFDYNITLWLEGGHYEVYETLVTPEVKEEGKPYVPEKREEKLVRKIECTKDIFTKDWTAYGIKINYNGIPKHYGEVE